MKSGSFSNQSGPRSKGCLAYLDGAYLDATLQQPSFKGRSLLENQPEQDLTGMSIQLLYTHIWTSVALAMEKSNKNLQFFPSNQNVKRGRGGNGIRLDISQGQPKTSDSFYDALFWSQAFTLFQGKGDWKINTYLCPIFSPPQQVFT